MPDDTPNTPTTGNEKMGEYINPMVDRHVNWLVHQLEAWPGRVDPEKTTNIQYLMQEAAKVIRRTPLPFQPTAEAVREACAKVAEDLTAERMAMQKLASEAGRKSHARDYQSMAMQSAIVASAIRSMPLTEVEL